MRALPETAGLLGLEGRLNKGDRGFVTREQARELLVEETGQDFGLDVAAWRKYLLEHDLLDDWYTAPTA